MPLINCKVELKLKWTKYCVLSTAGNENFNDNVNVNNGDNTIFTIKDTKLYVPVVTLSARDNEKLSKLLSEGFERSVYLNEYKIKIENKNMTNEYRHFLESNFVNFAQYIICFNSNQDADPKRFKAKWYLPKGKIKNYNVIITGKDFYDQPIDPDIKWYQEIRKLPTGQSEDYTTRRLLDYDYIKNHYRLIAIDLRRQKELDADPKAIQQIGFVGQLKELDAEDNTTDADNDQYMFVLTILEKIKEARLKFSQRGVTVL